MKTTNCMEDKETTNKMDTNNLIINETIIIINITEKDMMNIVNIEDKK